MPILDNFIIVTLIVLAFISGMKLDNKYNQKSSLDMKDALNRQFVRLKAGADADDPCAPYIAPRATVSLKNVDYVGTSREFENRLKTSGQAVMKFNKSDIAK